MNEMKNAQNREPIFEVVRITIGSFDFPIDRLVADVVIRLIDINRHLHDGDGIPQWRCSNLFESGIVTRWNIDRLADCAGCRGLGDLPQLFAHRHEQSLVVGRHRLRRRSHHWSSELLSVKILKHFF